MPITRLGASITATGTTGSEAVFGNFNLSIQGTWVGTIALQRSFDDGSTWETTDTFTSNTSTTAYEPEKGVLYRFNATAFTSGTATVRIGGGGHF